MTTNNALPVEGWTRDQQLTDRRGSRTMTIHSLDLEGEAQMMQIKNAQTELQELTWAEDAILRVNELAIVKGGAGRRDNFWTAQRKLSSMLTRMRMEVLLGS